MKKGYTLKFRRRLEGKTNYKKRLSLLKSDKHKLVIRLTNTKILSHITKYDLKEKTEKTIIWADSKELKKNYNWSHSTKNIPSAYLTGMLIAKKAKEAKIKEVIIDIGLVTPIKGSKVFAFIKGAVDNGLNIPHKDTKFPTDERIRGEHINNYKKSTIVQDFEKIKLTLNK
jgi:large subunit ribosomal protein L18